ncbi:Hypothetical protein PENO1_021380 [Penicillium occitanis (nom. inval.)]|nr:Hypothetical protein PENO1_021380 [Penicillium occitanis (nom. inval.)]PCH06199.1 hypothetical protein PENOC_024760 [Penicillium occitanis (nom. inval.)]
MASLIAAPNTYTLLKRFPMPHGNSTIDAVAVTSSHGLILVSFYTIIMKAIITQFWMAIVLFGVGLFLHRHSPHDSDSSATETTIGLWNVKHSPRHVVYFMTQRTWAVRTLRDVWYPLVWFAVAAAALAASLAVPIVKTQDLKVGTVAPVNPKSVFVPNFEDPHATYHETAQQLTPTVPSALRAVGAAGTIPNDTVYISSTTTPPSNSTVVQFNYSYGISGSDFGLQKTPDLWLNVSGSCITDYTWYQGHISVNNVPQEVYYLWNNPANLTYVYLSSDYGPAFVSPFTGPAPSTVNRTYALLVSSIGRQSISSSTDPWYLTQDIQDPTWPYEVLSGRPPLSCWETDIWSFRGRTSSTSELRNLTDNRLSLPIYIALGQYLFRPMIVSTTQRLGRASLASSLTAYGAGFDAEKCSLVADMTRLINSSYIATRNILFDATTISAEGQEGLPNVYLGDNGTILAGSDEFVISSPNIITLSVRVLIIVPAVFVGVVVLLTVLACLPDPWRSSKELNATRIHELKRQSTKSKPSNVRDSRGNGNAKQDGGDEANDGDGGNVSKEVNNLVTSIDV